MTDHRTIETLHLNNTLLHQYKEALNGVDPEKVIVVANDLDGCLLQKGDSQVDTAAKVRADNDIMISTSRETGKTVLQTIITARTAEQVVTIPKFTEFLNLKSIITTGSNPRQLPMLSFYPELGCVVSTNSNPGWNSTISEPFLNFSQKIRPQLDNWLYERYIRNGHYQYEEGSLVNLSLQATNNSPMDKVALAADIRQAWHEQGLTIFQRNVLIFIGGNDTDLVPKDIFHGGKIYGLTAVYDLFRNIVPSLKPHQVILVDDEGYKGARHTAAMGFRLVAPGNSHPMFRAVANAFETGHISNQSGFQGTMEALTSAIIAGYQDN